MSDILPIRTRNNPNGCYRCGEDFAPQENPLRQWCCPEKKFHGRCFEFSPYLNCPECGRSWCFFKDDIKINRRSARSPLVNCARCGEDFAENEQPSFHQCCPQRLFHRQCFDNRQCLNCGTNNMKILSSRSVSPVALENEATELSPPRSSPKTSSAVNSIQSPYPGQLPFIHHQRPSDTMLPLRRKVPRADRCARCGGLFDEKEVPLSHGCCPEQQFHSQCFEGSPYPNCPDCGAAWSIGEKKKREEEEEDTHSWLLVSPMPSSETVKREEYNERN